MAWVRRRSSAFSRGRSRFRGVSGQAGHWEARIGTFGDRKNVGTPAHPIYQRSSLHQEEFPEGCCQPWQQSSWHFMPDHLMLVTLMRRDTGVSIAGKARSSSSNGWDVTTEHVAAQVSFGIHETEEEAARQYDRALIVEKGRAAKTNFPIVLYEEEVAFFETSIAKR